jgi:hypothetical protein
MAYIAYIAKARRWVRNYFRICLKRPKKITKELEKEPAGIPLLATKISLFSL